MPPEDFIGRLLTGDDADPTPPKLSAPSVEELAAHVEVRGICQSCANKTTDSVGTLSGKGGQNG